MPYGHLTFAFKSFLMCDRKEQIERWTQCLRVMEELDEFQRTVLFDMTTWGKRIDGCGTVACAAGWCAMDAWFIKQGFSLRWTSGSSEAEINGIYEFFGVEGKWEIFMNPRFHTYDDTLNAVRTYIAKLKVNLG